MEEKIYHEKLSSFRTEALFVLLSVIFLSLFIWQWCGAGWNGWATTFLCLSVLFLFYIINYRTLKIHITPDTLQLTFGIFKWKIATTNIETCYIDENSISRYGGAGIHFMLIKGRYRAFFNFLEYSRVVVTLKKKKGLVQEIAFSTKDPEQVMKMIRK